MAEPFKTRIKSEEIAIKGENIPEVEHSPLEIDDDKVPLFSELTWRQQVALKAYFSPVYKSIREIMHENGMHVDSWFKWQKQAKFKKVFKHLSQSQESLLETEIARRITDRVESGYLPDRDLVKMYEVMQDKKTRQAKAQVNIHTGGGNANVEIMSDEQLNKELESLGLDPDTATAFIDADFTEEAESG